MEGKMRRRKISLIGILLICTVSAFAGMKWMTTCAESEKAVQRPASAVTPEGTVRIKEMTVKPAMEQKKQRKLVKKEAIMEEGTITQEMTKQKIAALPAGSVITAGKMSSSLLDELFYMEKIKEEIKIRINGKSYKENCDVPYDELRYIRVLHTDFEGKTRIGELIVNRKVAEDVVEIFEGLYSIKYPIERMVLVDVYNADDNASMEANNSSAFNFRYIDGTTTRSSHSDGLAIDINPFYNPYVRTRGGKREVLPNSAEKYADRTIACPYYIKKEDPCYKTFIKHGFTWGGDWINSKDYQHFQKSITE